MKTTQRFAFALAPLLAALAFPATGTFHLMKIVEVFGGTAASPNAKYVVLQMYASGQNLVQGHMLIVYDAAGAQVATYSFPQNVANSASQSKILIATPEAQGFFGVSADLTMSATIVAAGGKVCFDASQIDCVAWGNYTGTATGVGTPFNAGGGLIPGRAAIRRLDISGVPTLLEGSDDTNNCANDFVAGLPAPRNNAGSSGTVPPGTCGNGAIEALEQCDDHNTADGDGCSSTCQVTAVTPPAHPAAGDFNGDGRSDVFWRNTSNGTNVIWRSASATTQQSVATVSNQAWRVAGRGDFDADGRADVLWRNSVSGANTLWRSANAATPQGVAPVSSQAWQVAGVGDFNHDNRADILWRNNSSGANVIWRSGNSATPQAVATVATSWRVAGVGDFNNDGNADILWRSTSTGANVLWRSGSSAASQALRTLADQNWKVVGVGDFNNDGSADILWRNTATGANTIWRSGNAATPQAVATQANQNWQVVNVGDYDGDGRSDLFWRNLSTGGNVVWRGANAGTPMAVTGVTNLAWVVAPYENQPFTVSASQSPVLSIADVAVVEGDSGMETATFTVRLSRMADSPVTYDIATTPGSAMSPGDFVMRSQAGASIAAGQDAAPFAVSVVGDTALEGDEAFAVNVSHVAGATVGDGVATGTILDDDDPYQP